MDNKELAALVHLLDDTDENVFHHVNDKILSFGIDALPFLEQEFSASHDQVQHDRLESIILELKSNELKVLLRSWSRDDSNLFEGIFIINRFGYPDLKRVDLEREIEELKLQCWLELHYDLTSLEKVKIMNHIFFYVNKFKGDTQSYHSPSNSYVNKVLENKKGNPITLAILYIIVAQRLDIPVFGINLPQHFMLAYVDKEVSLRDDTAVLFYINPFNNGMVYNRSQVEQYLVGLGMKPEKQFIEPCSNTDIIRRVLRNLMYAYELEGRNEKVTELNELLKILD